MPKPSKVKRAGRAPADERASLLAPHLERALGQLTAELREDSRQPVELGPLVAFLNRLTQQVLAPGSQGENGTITALVDPAGNPATVQTALLAVERLQQALFSGVLAHLGITGETACEIERMFEVLSSAQAELLDHWHSIESLRRAELLAEGFHDLHSPLTSVLFLADALYGGQSGPLTQAQRRQIRLIYTASLTLLNLVDNVLSSRNFEAGEAKAELRPFSLAAIVEEVHRITRPLAEQSQLWLHFEPDCNQARIGDPDVLRRVLLNLVTNAISYTDDGGVTIRLQESDGDLVILVEDTGPGIAEQQLAELFTPFRAGRDDRGRGDGRFSGAGLGLSICHRLARLVGGDIWVETELGVGSRFGVRFPFPALEESRV